MQGGTERKGATQHPERFRCASLSTCPAASPATLTIALRRYLLCVCGTRCVLPQCLCGTAPTSPWTVGQTVR